MRIEGNAGRGGPLNVKPVPVPTRKVVHRPKTVPTGLDWPVSDPEPERPTRRKGRPPQSTKFGTDPKVVDAVIERYRRGETPGSIAEDYQVAPQTVRRMLNRHGVKTKPRSKMVDPA